MACNYTLIDILSPFSDYFQLNFTHLHKYETTNDPNRKIAITSGEFAVTKIIGTDHTRENVYVSDLGLFDDFISPIKL